MKAFQYTAHPILQVLGQWYEQGKVLIFVQSQEKCDTLFRDLLKV
jgi:ATP-dependent RNA helicase DDX46/PRP5